MKKILFIVLLIWIKQVNAQCSITITGTDTVCSGIATTLTASGATSYTWMPGGVNTPTITVTPSVTTTYSVTGTTGTCTATNTVAVIVHQIPTVTFTMNIDTNNGLWTIYPTYSSNVAGATWYFMFQSFENNPPYNGSGSSDTYYGLYPYGTITPVATIVPPPTTTMYTICVIARDSFGCADTIPFANAPNVFCGVGYLCKACYNPTTYSFTVSQNPTTKASQISTPNPQISIYPNPTNNIIHVEMKGTDEIKLYDLLGNEILSTKEKEIDVSNLTNGVYFIQVNNNTQKVIVQH